MLVFFYTLFLPYPRSRVRPVLQLRDSPFPVGPTAVGHHVPIERDGGRAEGLNNLKKICQFFLDFKIHIKFVSYNFSVISNSVKFSCIGKAD